MEPALEWNRMRMAEYNGCRDSVSSEVECMGTGTYNIPWGRLRCAKLWGGVAGDWLSGTAKM